MDAFCIWIHQWRVPPSPGILAIVRKFTLDGGYFQTSRIYEFQERGIAVLPRTIPLSHPSSHLLYIIYYILYIPLHPPNLSPSINLSPTQHFLYPSIPHPPHYYNLYHSPLPSVSPILFLTLLIFPSQLYFLAILSHLAYLNFFNLH